MMYVCVCVCVCVCSIQVPVIVKALHRQLKEKSIKSRQGCFCLLTELAHTVPGALEQHIPALIPGTYTHTHTPTHTHTLHFTTPFFLLCISRSFALKTSQHLLVFSFNCFIFSPPVLSIFLSFSLPSSLLQALSSP